MEWVFAQLEPLLKRSPVVFLALVVFFYCPDRLVGPEVAEFRQDYAGVIFLLICLTGASTVFRFLKWMLAWCKGEDMTWFTGLSMKEQRLLADMYLSGQPTKVLNVEASEIAKLVRFGYLVPCGTLALDECGRWMRTVSLSPWCIESFKRNEKRLRRLSSVD